MVLLNFLNILTFNNCVLLMAATNYHVSSLRSLSFLSAANTRVKTCNIRGIEILEEKNLCVYRKVAVQALLRKTN